MTTIMNRVRLTKPSFFKASPLLIAKMTCNKLRSYSMSREANEVSRKITGNTSVREAYKITSKYIAWQNHYEK
ncbi:hypothetical protein [Staphylococcus equorum]|uniref:hypothetical protein n=1 Tax=Staphylococcus equorum TaxID=246432 RepID=UPI003FD759C0